MREEGIGPTIKLRCCYDIMASLGDVQDRIVDGGTTRANDKTTDATFASMAVLSINSSVVESPDAQQLTALAASARRGGRLVQSAAGALRV